MLIQKGTVRRRMSPGSTAAKVTSCVNPIVFPNLARRCVALLLQLPLGEVPHVSDCSPPRYKLLPCGSIRLGRIRIVFCGEIRAGMGGRRRQEGDSSSYARRRCTRICPAHPVVFFRSLSPSSL